MKCIILRLQGDVKKGAFSSGVWYSKIFVFSFINVLLNFLKYLRSVLFPRIVISVFFRFCFIIVPKLQLFNDWVKFLVFL